MELVQPVVPENAGIIHCPCCRAAAETNASSAKCMKNMKKLAILTWDLDGPGNPIGKKQSKD
jgi:hypothetical protein